MPAQNKALPHCGFPVLDKGETILQPKSPVVQAASRNVGRASRWQKNSSGKRERESRNRTSREASKSRIQDLLPKAGEIDMNSCIITGIETVCNEWDPSITILSFIRIILLDRAFLYLFTYCLPKYPYAPSTYSYFHFGLACTLNYSQRNSHVTVYSQVYYVMIIMSWFLE